MAQKCCLCNLEFKNEEQYKQHIEGKKHKKLESIKQEREKTAQRSIFVSNLKKEIFQKHLEEYFIQFGKINKIVIDHEKNAYAIIEYENEESVEKVLAPPNEHKINEKHLKVSRREIKEFVSKLPNSSDKRKEVLDKIKEEALNVNKLLGACETFEEQVDKLIEYLKLDEEHLKLRYSICDSLKRIMSNFWNPNEFNVSIFGSTLNGLVCNGSDMDLTILFSQYLNENKHKQQKMPNLKHAALKTNNNNGQDSSDSNIAELDEDINLEETNDDENDHSLKATLQKFFNDKNYNQFLQFELDHQIKIISRILQRFYLDAKTIRTITNARCPMVRFFDNKAKIFCDISLNNFLAYENTKLIKLYMDLEPNLIKMIFVIRYWMKHKNLYSSSRFNSYTIIWLIIFYMQQKKIGYLPTVAELSKMTNQVNEIHGWNCAFETNLDKIRSLKPVNQTDANDFNYLLKGFFEFYSELDLTSNKIIVTNSAEISTDLDKTSLSKISLLNVQDPFDLSHNLSANISKNTLERFVEECKSSNELLQYSKSPRKCLHKGWGLILLTTKKALPIVKPPQITPKELVEKSMFKLKLFDEPNGQMNTNQDMTVRKAIEFVLFLFKNCLLFEQLNADELSDNKRKRFKMLNQICDRVDLLGLNCSPKRLKTSQNTSDDPNRPNNTYVCVMDENNLNNNINEEEEDKNEKLVSSFLFSVKNNTWQGRRNLKREYKLNLPNATEMEIENLVSKKLIESENKKSDSIINFRVKFSIDSAVIGEAPGSENHANLKIKFDMLDETNNQNDLINFTTFVHFLDIYINNCHEKFFTQWNLVSSN